MTDSSGAAWRQRIDARKKATTRPHNCVWPGEPTGSDPFGAHLDVVSAVSQPLDPGCRVSRVYEGTIYKLWRTSLTRAVALWSRRKHRAEYAANRRCNRCRIALPVDDSHVGRV